MDTGSGLGNSRNQDSSGGLQNRKKGFGNFSLQGQPGTEMAAGVALSSVTTITFMKTGSKHHCYFKCRAGGSNLMTSCHTRGAVGKVTVLHPNPSHASLGRGHLGV